MQAYPVADFSLHLIFPDDLDRLCLSLRRQHFPAPSVFRDFIVDEVWYDGQSESLSLLRDNFTTIFASLSNESMKSVANDWSVEFHYKEVFEETPAYQALIRLREVAQYARDNKIPILLHLLA